MERAHNSVIHTMYVLTGEYSEDSFYAPPQTFYQNVTRHDYVNVHAKPVQDFKKEINKINSRWRGFANFSKFSQSPTLTVTVKKKKNNSERYFQFIRISIDPSWNPDMWKGSLSLTHTPVSSVLPLVSLKEVEWLPACLYFLNLSQHSDTNFLKKG